MNKNTYVVSVKKFGFRYKRAPFKIVMEIEVASTQDGHAYVTEQVMKQFAKRRGKRWSSIRVKDFRVVDEVGLKRLRAAAKASVTISRKRAAKKAAVTRAKNKAAMQARAVKTVENIVNYMMN